MLFNSRHSIRVRWRTAMLKRSRYRIYRMRITVVSAAISVGLRSDRIWKVLIYWISRFFLTGVYGEELVVW